MTTDPMRDSAGDAVRRSAVAPATARKDGVDGLGVGVLILFSLLMGVNQPLIKIVNDAFHPAFQAGLRSLCATPLILAYAVWAQRMRALDRKEAMAGLVVGLLFSAEFMLLFNALEFTAVARSSVLFYTMPIWVAAAAHFLIPGERLTRLRGLGLVLAITGVALAFADRGGTAGPNQLLGDLMCLMAAMFWAGIALVTRTTALARRTPEMQLLYQLVVSSVVLLGLAPLFGEVLRAPTPELIGIFAFQVIVVVGFGFLSWFWALGRYPASGVASFSFLAPVFGVLASWAILGETISLGVIGALGLVGFGIFLVNWRPRAQR